MRTTTPCPGLGLARALAVLAGFVVLCAPASAGNAQVAAPSIVLTKLPGATLSSPVHVTNAGDGSGRLFVVEQTGTIRIFKDNAFLAAPFLDIHSIITCCGEQGLLSVAFHPNYASNGFFYVYYVNLPSTPGDITIARYHVSANPDVADPTSAVILLVIPHPTNTNHYGGQLLFGPDGYLYAGTGDGGSGGDPPNNAQNTSVMLGKLLRIDVDSTGAIPCGQSSPMPYGIPSSNPFATSMTECREIWAYGLRNPWRYGFDRLTGDLLIGDVGQNLYEEVDFQLVSSAGGENYGWRRMEGFHCYDPPPCDDGTLTLPILEYTHDLGCAVTGGFRYRGGALPALQGIYLYSDACTGPIWGATEAGDSSWTSQTLLDTSYSVVSFGEDESGEVYVVDHNGAVYRIEPPPNPSPTISSLAPTSAIAGDPNLTLTVNGSGFLGGSAVRWNGSDRSTTFVSGSKLTAAVPATDIDTTGTASVTVFSPGPGGGLSNALTFNINPTFLDVGVNDFGYPSIQAVYNAGVTAGCVPRMFCPDAPTSRAEMAVFLLKAHLGSVYTPPACVPPGTFPDVSCPDAFAVKWIEDLAARNITIGCGAGKYCPDAPVSRAEMAVFLLKTSLGSAYVPPVCAPPGIFEDVTCPGAFAVNWIEDLFQRGITAGCNPGVYCPDGAVSRAQMAIFLTKTFSLPLP